MSLYDKYSNVLYVADSQLCNKHLLKENGSYYY